MAITEETPLAEAPLQTEQPVEPKPIRVFNLNRVSRNKLEKIPTNDPDRLFFTAQERYNYPKSTKRQGLPKKYEQQFSVSFSEDFPSEKRQKLANFLVNTQPSFLHRPDLHIKKLENPDLSTGKRAAFTAVEHTVLKPANLLWRKLGTPIEKLIAIGSQDPTRIPNLSGAAFQVMNEDKIAVVHYYASTKENRGWAHEGIISLKRDKDGKLINPHVRYNNFTEEENELLAQFKTTAEEYFREPPSSETAAAEENFIEEDAASNADAEPEDVEEETAANAQATQKISTAEDDDTLSQKPSTSKGKGAFKKIFRKLIPGSRASASQPKEPAPAQAAKPQVVSLKAVKTPGELVFEAESNPDALKYTRTYNGRDPQKYFVYQATTAGGSDKATSLASRALHTLMSNETKLTQKFGTGRVTSVAVHFTGPKKAEVTFVAQKGRDLGGSTGGGQEVKGTLSLEQKTPKLTFQTSEETLLVTLDRKLTDEYQEAVKPKTTSDATPSSSPAPEVVETQTAEESAAQTPSPPVDTGVSETEPETSPSEDEQSSGEETDTEQEPATEPAREEEIASETEAREDATRRAAIVARLAKSGIAKDPLAGLSTSHHTIAPMPQRRQTTGTPASVTAHESSAPLSPSNKPQPAPRHNPPQSREEVTPLAPPVVATEGPSPEISEETGEDIPDVALTNALANNDGEHTGALDPQDICGTEEVPGSIATPNEGIIVQSGDSSVDPHESQNTPGESSQAQHDSSEVQPAETPGSENATFEAPTVQGDTQTADSPSFDSPTAPTGETTFTPDTGTSFVADTGGASSGISGGESNSSTADGFSADTPGGGGGMESHSPAGNMNGGVNDNSAPESSNPSPAADATPSAIEFPQN